jgi:hypothetical protein
LQCQAADGVPAVLHVYGGLVIQDLVGLGGGACDRGSVLLTETPG